jgi:hypothetical protein
MESRRSEPSVRTLLHDVLPQHVQLDVDHLVARLIGDGREVTVGLRGDAEVLRAFHRIGTDVAFAAGSVLVLRIVDGTGDTRIDLAVEVVEGNKVRSVLRVHARPVVLRRRMVRDHALAEAVGAPMAPTLVA